ncbi:MAG: FAD-dependent oxidoreductase [Nitrospinota bacterium]|nr:FAD-dependent oxidoreductase [Nitrospinota bacterium]
MVRQVIVGGGTAGWNAITTLREIDRGDSNIVLISNESPYSRMVLPYYLSKEIGESQVFTASKTRLENLNIELKLGKDVKELDSKNSKIVLEDGEEVDYDNLLIATGSSPVRPPIPGSEGKNVSSFWTLPQAREVTSKIKKNTRVTMIGAGFISFTILNALISRGVDLTVVEVEKHILPRMLDEQGAKIVSQWLVSKGVDVRVDCKVLSIDDYENEKLIKFNDGTEQKTDLVIMATGIKPNIDWLTDSDLNLDEGILVDKYCRTNISNIYAAGDVAKGIDIVTGKSAVHAIEPTAVQHGRIAASNMSGKEVSYKGSLLMNILDVFGLEIASFGAWDEEGSDTILKANLSRPSYRKMIFDHGRMVGSIAIGLGDDVWHTNDIGMLRGLIYTQSDLTDWKDHIKRNPFDIKRAFLASGSVGKLLSETLVGIPSVPEESITISS